MTSTDFQKEYDLFLLERGYRCAQIDLQEILLELKTPDNIALLLEIDERIHHNIEMRIASQFAETLELSKE